jgi:molybdopterin-guanine dinucleotide biosynthesis protein A
MCCDPVATVGGEQERLTSLGLEVLADRTPGAGPLDGVIRALEAAGGSPAVVVACDMPWLSAALVGALVDALRRSSGALDVVVARGERLEPLCAVWAPSALPVLVAAFDDGERAVHRTFDRLRLGEVAVGADEVRNVNTPADLADVLRGEGTSGG